MVCTVFHSARSHTLFAFGTTTVTRAFVVAVDGATGGGIMTVSGVLCGGGSQGTSTIAADSLWHHVMFVWLANQSSDPTTSGTMRYDCICFPKIDLELAAHDD